MLDLNEKNMGVLVSLLKSGNLCGWWRKPNGGEIVQEFEKSFKEYIGVDHAIAVSTGTSSIYVALRACGVGQGSIVGLNPYTHIGSLAPIILAGATPLFFDVDKYGNINHEEIRKYEGRLDAVLVAHQQGNPADMFSLLDLPQTPYIIEDASQCLGAEIADQKVGGIGDIGCFSVGGDMTKTISTGEGGVIVTNREELAQKCRAIRNHGDREGFMESCFNFRMSDWNAALGLMQMPKIEEEIKHQNHLGRYLIKNLPKYLYYPESPKHVTPAYYFIVCEYLGEDRGKFMVAMDDAGYINGPPRKNISVGYSKLLYQIPLYQMFAIPCPVAEQKMRTSVWIDHHRFPRTQEEVDGLIECLKGFSE